MSGPSEVDAEVAVTIEQLRPVLELIQPGNQAEAALAIINMIQAAKKRAARQFGMMLLKNLRNNGLPIPLEAIEMVKAWNSEV